MKIADLQQFVNGLVHGLTPIGNQALVKELGQIAHRLEPFKDLTLAQFFDFLDKADGYSRTGILPITGKAPKKGPGQPGMSVQDALQRVLALYEKAVDPELQYESIKGEIDQLKKLKKDELSDLAREFGIAKKMKTKPEILKEIERKITERKGSFERIQFRAAEAMKE